MQNASLEISWSAVALDRHSIAGETVLPFLTEGWEGFDINHHEDFAAAERALAEGRVETTAIDRDPPTRY